VSRALRFALALLLTLAVAAPLPAAKKKRVNPVPLRLGLTEGLPSLAVTAPAQKCENWAWAAGVEAILRTQNVPLDQHFWAQKADGGEICLETLRPLADLARVVDGEYVVDVGRKVKLEARYTVGAPVNTASIVHDLHRGQPSLLVWKGHPYLIYGVLYDEYWSPAGFTFFEIRELRLLDPFYEDQRRTAVFVRGQDDPAQIGGVFEITVTEFPPTDWLHREK
jgi:hypothetical protein